MRFRARAGWRLLGLVTIVGGLIATAQAGALERGFGDQANKRGSSTRGTRK